jgi:hypothetical protein
MIAVEPPRFPWRAVLDGAVELGAIISAVSVCQLICWGMWALR